MRVAEQAMLKSKKKLHIWLPCKNINYLIKKTCFLWIQILNEGKNFEYCHFLT